MNEFVEEVLFGVEVVCNGIFNGIANIIVGIFTVSKDFCMVLGSKMINFVQSNIDITSFDYVVLLVGLIVFVFVLKIVFQIISALITCIATLVEKLGILFGNTGG